MRGLTLLEVLISIGILSFVILGVFSVLSVGGANYSTNFASLGLQQQARQGMSWLVREVRQAKWNSVNPLGPDENGNSSITFDMLNAATGTGVHYFVTKTVASGRELWQLQRTDNAHPAAQTKANDIRVLTISKNDAKHIINIGMQASKTIRSFGKDQTLTFSLNEQIRVRNYNL